MPAINLDVAGLELGFLTFIFRGGGPGKMVDVLLSPRAGRRELRYKSYPGIASRSSWPPQDNLA